MSGFSFGVVFCRHCKGHQLAAGDDDKVDRTNGRVADVVCARCGNAGTYWADRRATGLTKEQAHALLAQGSLL